MMIYQYTAAALGQRAQGAGPSGVRRLDPDVGQPGGPRLDGVDRGAPRADGPDRRRADPRDRAARRRPGARPAAARCGESAGTSAARRAPASPRPTAGSGLASRTSTATASRGPTSRRRPRWSTTARWRTWPGPGGLGVTAPTAGPDRHRRRHRRLDVRPPAAVRRSRVRSPVVRLLGGRRPRVEGDPARLDRARRAPSRRSRRPAPRRPTRSSPTSRNVGRTRSRSAWAVAARARPTRSSPDDDALDDNPFAPRRAPRPTVADTAPRKLRLLARGLGVGGSYAKVLLADDVPAAYCQFGPLTAYPRAQRTRDLYPALPDAPLPAVITCIASTAEARGAGLAKALVAAVCEDLEGRGFAAVETYPEIGARPDATSAATPAFWEIGRVRHRGARRALPGHAPRARVRRSRLAGRRRRHRWPSCLASPAAGRRSRPPPSAVAAAAPYPPPASPSARLAAPDRRPGPSRSTRRCSTPARRGRGPGAPA